MHPAYELAVLLSGFVLLMVLVMRGRSIFVAAPLCALLILIFSGADPLEGMTVHFMTGFAEYLRRFFPVFALGAAFGKLMEDSGAALSISKAILARLGSRWACLAVVLACAVLTYGGVSLFVVGFSIYPLAVRLFREADLPRRYIPAAIAFGSVTFTMTTAGAPAIQNLIPIQYLVDARTKEPLTDALAGWPASFIVAVLMFVAGQLYLEWSLRRSLARGERFEPRPEDQKEFGVERANLPGILVSILPLAVTLLALNALPRLACAAAEWFPDESALAENLAHFPEDPALAIFLGVFTAALALWRHVPSIWDSTSAGFVQGLIAIGATCSVVGFGSAIQGLPAFQGIVAWITALPADPLFGAALAVAVIAGLSGSASGGQSLAWPILIEEYVERLDVPPRALHRVVAIASGTFDTQPANGYLVVLIRNICGETHARSYFPIFITTAVIPLGGTVLAIGLFKLFPQWAWM